MLAIIYIDCQSELMQLQILLQRNYEKLIPSSGYSELAIIAQLSFSKASRLKYTPNIKQLLVEHGPLMRDTNLDLCHSQRKTANVRMLELLQTELLTL